MTQRTLTLARAGDENAFRELTDPHRHELQLHCYRIVGSTQDAEDLVQRHCWPRGADWTSSPRGPRSGPGCTELPPTDRWTRCERTRAGHSASNR